MGAGLILVGFIGVLNLLLTVGVIGRLREHERRLPAAPAGSGGETALAAGQRVGPFTTETVDGAGLAESDLADGTVVAFLSPSCGPCTEALPGFLRYATDRTFAVVLDENDDATDEMVRKLREATNVVRERFGGPMSKAFAVTGFPAFVLVGKDQLVAASGVDLSDLPVARDSPLRTGRG